MTSAMYRLDELAQLAFELCLKTKRPDEHRLDIYLTPEIILSFYNLIEEDDTRVGFDGTPWHSHGIVSFLTGTDSYIECDELSIMVGLASGELLVVSQYLKGNLTDRWIAHNDEALELQYLQAGEELRILKINT